MNNVIRTAGTLAVLTIMWAALTELWTGPNLVLGLFVALISVLTIRALHDVRQSQRWSFRSLGIWLLYGIWLIGQIYLSGILTVINIFRGQTMSVLVNVKTELTDDFLIAVLAASITLTPGTVTVAREGNELLVLWLVQKKVKRSESIKMVVGRLEGVLLMLQNINDRRTQQRIR